MPAASTAAGGERRRIVLAGARVGIAPGSAPLAVGGAAVMWLAATSISSALPALVLAPFAAALWRGASVIVAAATGLYAAAVGSSSGGLILALTAHGESPLSTGVTDPQTRHRVAALASGVLDTLPHSGAVLALLAICRATHAKSHHDIFVVTVIGPALALGTVLLALR